MLANSILVLIKRISLIFIIVILTACNPPYGPDYNKNKCKNCHKITLDKAHNFACTKCHEGNNKKSIKKSAHKNLIKHPASLENAKKFCLPCHKSQVLTIQDTIHYTLKNEITVIWQNFFPDSKVPKLNEIVGSNSPQNPKELIKDMLARRCLKCHVYFRGEEYVNTSRGLGCAACHLKFSSKGSHVFHPPTMLNCLSCHYGNWVGWDYVGRFEKDYPEDFRAPLKNGKHLKRAYGIEWIDLSPDIHFKKGMTCLSCHSKHEFHPRENKHQKASCRTCHSKLSNILGHQKQPKISCAVCHAKWGFYDFGRNLLRVDNPDLEEWSYLKVQGSSELERNQTNMLDKLHHKTYKGIWLSGFEKRRWSPIILGLSNKQGLIVLRPLLDIVVSYLDEDDELIFNKIKPVKKQQALLVLNNSLKYHKNKNIWQKYTPHSIGKADIFRSLFVKKILKKLKDNNRQ